MHRHLVEFAGGKVTRKDGLCNQVGRLGVADDAQRAQPAVDQRRLQLMVQRVAGDPVCHEQHTVDGISASSAAHAVDDGDRIETDP